MPPGVAQTQAIVRVEQEPHTGTAAVFKGGFKHLNWRILPRMTGLGHRKFRPSTPCQKPTVTRKVALPSRTPPGAPSTRPLPTPENGAYSYLVRPSSPRCARCSKSLGAERPSGHT